MSGSGELIVGGMCRTSDLTKPLGKLCDSLALDDAIKISRWGLQISYGDPHHGDHLRQLADLLREIYAGPPRSGRSAGGDPPAEDCGRAPAGGDTQRGDDPHEPGRGTGALGSATKDADIIRGGVQSLRTARAACGTDTTLAAAVDHNLALALSSLYKRTSQPDVLAEAVHFSGRHWRGHPGRAPPEGSGPDSSPCS